MREALRLSAVLSAFVVWLVGCSTQGIKTHPVAGKVEIKDGDVALLAGGMVELKHESDETLRPYGNIDSSGSFTVKTLYQGEVLPGAPEGKYLARIILGEEGDEGVPKRKGTVVHPRYLEFSTSKLSFTVPGGDTTVLLSKK